MLLDSFSTMKMLCWNKVHIDAEVWDIFYLYIFLFQQRRNKSIVSRDKGITINSQLVSRFTLLCNCLKI